jgi:hypothetical protein
MVGFGLERHSPDIRRLQKRIEALETTTVHRQGLPEDWIGKLAKQTREKAVATNSQTHDWMVRLALQHLSAEQQQLLHSAAQRSGQGPYTEAESAAFRALLSEVELIYQL